MKKTENIINEKAMKKYYKSVLKKLFFLKRKEIKWEQVIRFQLYIELNIK